MAGSAARTPRLADVERALAAPLPGYAAQARMATRPRLVLTPGEHSVEPTQSAVLLALYERDGALRLPLTLRSNRVAHHRGQISFPGGVREAQDPDLWATALREAQEEIGLAPASVRRLGSLSPLLIPASCFLVHPFVASLAAPPLFRPASDEVAEIIELPLALLLDPAARQEEQRLLHDQWTRVPFYRYSEHAIWGATAMMLSEFEVLLTAALAEGGAGALL